MKEITEMLIKPCVPCYFWAGRISPFFLHNVVRLAGRPGLSDSYYTTSDDVNDDNDKSEIIIIR